MHNFQVTDGAFSIHMEIDMIVTLTTLKRGRKGRHATPPRSKEFPLPYHDTFESESKLHFSNYSNIELLATL